MLTYTAKQYVKMTDEQLTEELYRAMDDGWKAEGTLNYEYLDPNSEFMSETRSDERYSAERSLFIQAELQRRGVEPPVDALFWSHGEQELAHATGILQEAEKLVEAD